MSHAENLALAQENVSQAIQQSATTGKSFKKFLTSIYEAIFAENGGQHGVVIKGVEMQGQPYVAMVNKNAVGKVIADVNLSAEKLAVFNVLDEVIASGEYVGSGEYIQHGPKQKDTIRFDYFETEATIGGRPYIVSFDVEVFPSTNNYRTHKIINEIDLTPVNPKSTVTNQPQDTALTDVGSDLPQGATERGPSLEKSIPQPDPTVKTDETTAKRSGPMSRQELTEQILARSLPLPQGSGDGQMERVIREGIQKGLTKLAQTSEGKLALFNLALWKGDGFGKAFDDAIVDWVVWNTPDNPAEGSDQLADALYTTLVDYFQNKLAGDKVTTPDEAKTKLTRPDSGSKGASLNQATLQKAPWSDIIGVVTCDGHTVEKLKDHLFDRAEARIVSEDEAIDALIHPLHQTSVKFDDHGQPSVQYIGTTATVVYNPDTNTVVTIWRTGKRYRKKYGGGKQ